MSKENIQKAIQEKIAAAQLLAQEYPQYITAEKTKTLEKMVAIFQKMIVKPIMSASMPQGEMGSMTASRMEGEMGVNAPQIDLSEMCDVYEDFATDEIGKLSTLLLSEYIINVPSDILLVKSQVLSMEANRKNAVFKSLATDLLAIITNKDSILIIIEAIIKKLSDFINILSMFKDKKYDKDKPFKARSKEDSKSSLAKKFGFSSVIELKIEDIKKKEIKAKEKALLEELKDFIGESNKELADKFQAQIDAISLNTQEGYAELRKLMAEFEKKNDKTDTAMQKLFNTLNNKIQELENKVIENSNENRMAIKQLNDAVDTTEQSIDFINTLVDFNAPLQYKFIFSERDNFFGSGDKQYRMPLLTRVICQTTLLASGNCKLTNPSFKVVYTEGLEDYKVKQIVEFEYDLIFDELKIIEEKDWRATFTKWVSNIGALGFAIAALVSTGGTAIVPILSGGSAALSFLSNTIAEFETTSIEAIQNIQSGRLKLRYELNYRYLTTKIKQDNHITNKQVVVNIKFISGQYKDKMFTLQDSDWAKCFGRYTENILINRNL